MRIVARSSHLFHGVNEALNRILEFARVSGSGRRSKTLRHIPQFLQFNNCEVLKA